MEEEIQNAEALQPSERTRPHWGRIAAWMGLGALLILLFFGLLKSQKGQMGVGEKAPDFTLTTFDGQTYRLSDLRGKVVLVNIWASWCKPCEQEAADLEAGWRAYEPGGEVVFLGVAWTDTDKKSLEYLEKYGITYPNGPDLGTRIYQDFRDRRPGDLYHQPSGEKRLHHTSDPQSSAQTPARAPIPPLGSCHVADQPSSESAMDFPSHPRSHGFWY